MGTDETQPKGKFALRKSDSLDKESWSDFIWNGRTGQFFGRTGASWAKIFIFYVIFYCALAAFAWLCYYLFSLTLEQDRPKWILDSSLIGTNPGVGFRPMPDQEENSGSSLIWYRRDNEADAAVWYQQLSNYTDAIEDPKEVDSLQICNYNNGKHATKWKSCRVDIKEFGTECTKQNKFGYTTGEPCILIKLNRIFGWKPEPFGINRDEEYDEAQLEEDLKAHPQMPQSLQNHIRNGAKTVQNPTSFLNTVWISCVGENVSDEETIGTVEYFPRPGIPGYYFPYYRQTGYQSPFIFVRLLKPRPGVLINIECRAWAKNIIYDKHNRLGSVHFEVLID